MVEDEMGPFQDPLALGRKPDEALAAGDDRHPKLLLELADAARKGRLGDIAGLGGAREVLLAGQGGQILQLPNIHGATIACEACPSTAKN